MMKTPKMPKTGHYVAKKRKKHKISLLALFGIGVNSDLFGWETNKKVETFRKELFKKSGQFLAILPKKNSYNKPKKKLGFLY